jgi:Domain of unknown function (DUF222)
VLANSREEIVEVFDALHTAVSRLAELSFDALTTPERLDLVERLEHATRRLPVPRHALINGVRREATAAEIGGKLPHVLADLATQYRPELLNKLAHKLADCLNPDGTFSDQDRARRRGLTLGKQDRDGMSPLRGWLTPTARAALEPVLAKLAAPGMADPYAEKPVLDGTPSQDAIDRDTRSPAQRNHDGLHAALRAVLTSGSLGQHNGLPASIVVSTTLEELEAATGTAVTGGGTRLPMKDVIRLAGHAHHYLTIFDNSRAIGLYHTKRLASPGQRIVLYAKDRGCSHPGCDVPGYLCEVHHVTDFASAAPPTSMG